MKDPLHILTPFQVKVLGALGKERLLKDFYLTGGTALSAFYFHHRLSDDLDFFTEVPQGVAHIPPLIRRVAKSLKARIALGRRFETLFECSFVYGKNERLEMDFALDMPGRLKPVLKEPQFKIGLDNLLDISCNKLSALYERADAKDFVDIFFIHRDYLSLPQLIRKARKKYPELDDYGLAMAFFKIKGVTHWPKMKKPLNVEKLRDFFLDHAARLSKDFTQ